MNTFSNISFLVSFMEVQQWHTKWHLIWGVSNFILFNGVFYNTNWFYHNSQLLLWTLSRSEVGRSDGGPIGKINLFGFFLETGSELIWLSRWVGHSTNCMKEWCDQDARTGLFLWTRGEPNSIFKGWCWCPHEHLLAHPCAASRTSLKRVPRIPTGWCCTQRGIWSPFYGNWNSFWF